MLALRRRDAGWVGVGVLALMVRVAYVLGTSPRKMLFTDTLYYQLQANYLAKGRGFVMPTILLFRRIAVPSAAHPPLYPLYLAAGSLLGATSVQAHQLMGCVLGVATVICIGLVAGGVAGNRAGLIAATLAAVYPPLWLNDGGIMAEGLFGLIVVVILLASYRFLACPTLGRAAILGALIGAATLTRAEAVLLLPVLALPLVVAAKPLDFRRRLTLLGVVVVATVATISPWAIRNLSTFQNPVILSTGDAALGAANCDPTYRGPLIGLWVFGSGCFPTNVAAGDESVSATAQRDLGLHYISHHLSRFPLVMAVREARVWQLYRPLQDADVARDDNRPKWGNRVGLLTYAAAVPLALGGALVLRRRRVSLLPLVAQILGVCITAALVWGTIRFRAPAEVVLMVLGGVGVDAALSRFRLRSGRTRHSPGFGVEHLSKQPLADGHS